MVSKSMEQLVKGNSVIRALFEEGKEMAAKVGAENVYDFSLGNPSVPAPKAVRTSMKRILDEDNSLYVHGYMSNEGYEEVREAVAASLNKRFGTSFAMSGILMTVGAAGGLNVVLRTLLDPGDEVICFAPFFGEYRNYVSNYQGSLVVIPPDTDTFQLNLSMLDEHINERTKAIIINNPNNPTGVIYSGETLDKLEAVLKAAEARIGHSIYVISDEPYRELVYDGAVVPFMTKHIRNTIICYSFSKSLSLPGERIGYLAVPEEVDDYAGLVQGMAIANRVLGFVNAPSLQQLMIKDCLEEQTDVGAYDKNRKFLYTSLKDMGFECVKPEGAFYLFVKSPVEDEKIFVAEAKKHHLLLVPASSFGCPGYVRIAYCVSYDMIERSMPAFKALAETYFG
ncbi:MAG: pyridoxal phosphate-dependent aminotransferase [Clostridia bacterium]|jgi:aspartate aminotransferase|nr:pyridoxal phosphate-dependent aminotransferase [Lachnospiraceae bacterium]NCB99794.1 pyridoxal phosphate-dependent aminotransferase [Clostridia bacterium]NCD01941.1 pyridoxal phosphate-dependent aminotransferase [Clostridia bacterium]